MVLGQDLCKGENDHFHKCKLISIRIINIHQPGLTPRLAQGRSPNPSARSIQQEVGVGNHE